MATCAKTQETHKTTTQPSRTLRVGLAKRILGVSEVHQAPCAMRDARVRAASASVLVVSVCLGEIAYSAGIWASTPGCLHACMTVRQVGQGTDCRVDSAERSTDAHSCCFSAGSSDCDLT